MQTLYYVHEIKWAVLIFMLVSYSDRATAEDEITSPPVALLPQSSGTRVNPVMAIVLVSLLSVFFMICVISAYFRHYAELHLRLASTTHGSETGSMRSTVHGLDPAVIASFASFLYSSVKGIKIGQTVLECAVCLNEFQDHETLRLLPKCSHVFHRECIDTWLVSHVTCPVCRADLVLGPGETSHATEPHDSVDPDRDFASTEFLLPIEAKHFIPPTTDMPRSRSTGHSVAAQPVENIERYTLRLPNEAHGLFVNLGTSLPTSPHIAFPLESSEKKTFRSISVGSTRRLDFIQYDHSNLGRGRGETSRSVPSSSHVASHGNDLAITTNSQQIFRSVISPFDRFFKGSNRNFDVDERSTDNVTPDVEV